MASTIKIKNSSTAGAAPTASDLVQGELAVNVTDKRIYTENASGTVVELGTNPSVPVTFPDGSASAPSLTNDGDTNTGIYFPAADTVGVTTGGTERVRVDSSGNVGIGTNSPSANFQIQKAVPTMWIAETTSGTLQRVESSVSSVGVVNQNLNWNSGSASRAFTWSQGGTENMRIDSSGNVGIGTSSPSSRLTVDGGDAAIKTGNKLYLWNAANNNAPYLKHVNGGIGFFNTSDSQAMQTDSSGNLLVGTTSTFDNVSSLKFQSLGGVATKIAGTSLTSQMSFFNDNGRVGYIGTNGTTTSYNTSSDYRLKENIAPMIGALSVVAALKPVTYTWKADGANGQGFIAHELQAVVPDCVTGEKDAVDADGNPVYQGIDTSFLVATLTAAIQELKATVDAQAARITALEQA